MEFLFIPAMIFCHIMDDFYLQRILADFKQKKFWEDNYPDKIYRYDYKAALIIHSISWAFMIQLPIFIWIFVSKTFTTRAIVVYFASLLVNAVIHAFIDNAKANWRIIGLCVDQVSHLVQILLTWVLWRSMVYVTTL